ncbi:diguanylate cyclase [Shewanella canadensis]|uniref:Diguanylate cyclase n=1 Tax=Shewanella canadensis TaxID=271096 RepID=A0A3S0LMI6_9GAMM|nr:diguanylate cyclase [Shewanella canadensis]RTR39008.1 diguanylate cyclase [Shewanella canadensis]
MSIRLKLSLLLGLLFFAAIFNSILTFQLESYGEEKLKWVIHTHEVLNETQTLSGAMKDAETGQRGYLLTASSAYLEPYHNGVLIAKESFIRLKALTSDNPAQQDTLNLIESQMLLKFEEMEETIELVQGDNNEMAVQIVSDNRGKQYMDNIRSLFATFINAETLLLEQRKGDFRENRAQITTLIIVEIVLFIGLFFVTISFLRRSFFHPLELLLSSVKKLEDGHKIEVSDVVKNDEMGHLLSTFFVMSEKVYQREQDLGFKAHHDELTGLKNRLTMPEEIETVIGELQQTGGMVAVLFIDLDRFKQINDQYGHHVGDLVIKEAAYRIKYAVRDSDTVFRVGGDEFLVIVKSIKNITDVHNVVNNIVGEFKSPASIEGKEVDISISVGVAVSPEDSMDRKEIIKFADVAMYAAKQDIAACYRMFDKGMLRRGSDSG